MQFFVEIHFNSFPHSINNIDQFGQHFNSPRQWMISILPGFYIFGVRNHHQCLTNDTTSSQLGNDVINIQFYQRLLILILLLLKRQVFASFRIDHSTLILHLKRKKIILKKLFTIRDEKCDSVWSWDESLKSRGQNYTPIYELKLHWDLYLVNTSLVIDS